MGKVFWAIGILLICGCSGGVDSYPENGEWWIGSEDSRFDTIYTIARTGNRISISIESKGLPLGYVHTFAEEKEGVFTLVETTLESRPEDSADPESNEEDPMSTMTRIYNRHYYLDPPPNAIGLTFTDSVKVLEVLEPYEGDSYSFYLTAVAGDELLDLPFPAAFEYDIDYSNVRAKLKSGVPLGSIGSVEYEEPVYPSGTISNLAILCQDCRVTLLDNRIEKGVFHTEQFGDLKLVLYGNGRDQIKIQVTVGQMREIYRWLEGLTETAE